MLLGLLSGGAAMVFQRAPHGGEANSSDPASSGHIASPARGRIVPLVVDSGESVAAFVPSSPPPNADESTASKWRLRALPTIRASASSDAIEDPTLAPDFPRPKKLTLLDEAPQPINAPTPVRQNNATGVAGRNDAAPIIAAKPVATSPQSHVIVDGDTLPCVYP